MTIPNDFQFKVGTGMITVLLFTTFCHAAEIWWDFKKSNKLKANLYKNIFEFQVDTKKHDKEITVEIGELRLFLPLKANEKPCFAEDQEDHACSKSIVTEYSYAKITRNVSILPEAGYNKDIRCEDAIISIMLYEKSLLMFWCDNEFFVFINLGRLNMTIKKHTEICFPKQDGKYRTTWTKTFLNEYLGQNQLKVLNLVFAESEIFNLEVITSSFPNRGDNGKLYNLQITLYLDKVLMLVFNIRKRYAGEEKHRINLSLNNITSNKQLDKFGDDNLRNCSERSQTIYKIRITNRIFSVSCSNDNKGSSSETLVNHTFNTTVNLTGHVVTSVASVYNQDDNPTLYYRLVRSDCSYAEADDPLPSDLNDLTLLSENQPVASSLQHETGRADAVVDGDTSGIFRPDEGRYCSQELRQIAGNYLEIHFLRTVKISYIILYQVSNIIKCDVYKYKLLNGSKILINDEIYGTISPEKALKSIIVFSVIAEGSIVKFEAGTQNSITLCEIQVWGQEQTSEQISIDPPGIYDKLIGESINQNFAIDFENYRYNSRSCVTVELFDDEGNHIESRECCDGDQAGYRGQLNITYNNRNCLHWTEKYSNISEMETEGIGNHNFCRNPSSQRRQRVWCFVDTSHWEYCAISSCNCKPNTEGNSNSKDGDGSEANVNDDCEQVDKDWSENKGDVGSKNSGDGSSGGGSCEDGNSGYGTSGNGSKGDDSKGDDSKGNDSKGDNGKRDESSKKDTCINDASSSSRPYSQYDKTITEWNLVYNVNVKELKRTLHYYLKVSNGDQNLNSEFSIHVSNITTDFKPVVFISDTNDSCVQQVKPTDINSTDILICPNNREIFTRKVIGSFCFFSKKCENDSRNYQSCGCNHVQMNEMEWETKICKPAFLEENSTISFMPISTNQLCDGIGHCHQHENETEADESCGNFFTNSDTNNEEDNSPNLYTCYDEHQISSDKKCNGEADCIFSFTYHTNGEKLYFYEDELNCAHEAWIKCNKLVHNHNYTIIVPPKYQCQGYSLCDNNQDGMSCSKEYEVRSCEKTLGKGTTITVTLYKNQICDDSYEYCNNWKIPMYNCREQWEKDVDKYTPLNCNVKGVSTNLTLRMECDQEYDCENGEDEDCIVIGQTCLLHTRHINVNDDGYLWKIYSQREGCVSSTKQKRINHSYYEIFNGIFGKPYYKNYTKCPGKNSTHVLLNQLCDGYNNCKQKPSERSEEEACNSEAGDKTLFLNKAYIRHMPACLPGIFHQGKCEKLEKAMGFITNPTLILETNQSYHCEATWGMIYSLLKCFNRCHDSSTTECPLKVLSTKCYDNQQYSMAVDPDDTKRVHYVYHDGMDYISMFQCEASDTCIPMDKFCDNHPDCDDMSDMNCDNYISCDDNSSKYHKRLKCDGVYHCMDKSDECNEVCSDSILKELWMKAATVVIGVSAIAINMVSLAMFLWSLNQSKSLSSVINDTLVALISLGDLIVGIYMLCLFIADATKTKYCAEKYKWLGSIDCNALGVMSTFGSNISLLSMTALSIFRIVSLKIMLVFSDKNKKTILLLIALVAIIVFWSLSMSLMPTFNYFEDYFVNGIYYENNPMFRSSTTRDHFFNALEFWNITSNERFAVEIMERLCRPYI